MRAQFFEAAALVLLVVVAGAIVFGLFKTAPGGARSTASVLWQFEKNLYAGLRGDPDVSQLQAILSAEGLYAGPITGNFFTLTKAAVQAFQTREYITPASGYFGPLTRGRLNEILRTQAETADRSETANAASESANTSAAPSPAPAPAETPNVFTLRSIAATAVSNNVNPQTIYAELTFNNSDQSGIVLTRLNFAPLSVRANADAFVRGESASALTLYNCARDTSNLPSFTNTWEFDYTKSTSLYTYIYVPPAASRPVCLKITKVTIKGVTEGTFALPLAGAEIDRADVAWNARTLNGGGAQEIVWTVSQ